MTRVILINEQGQKQFKEVDTTLNNSQVATILGGPVTFLGKLNADDVVLIKERAKGRLNPFRFDNLPLFRGKAMVIRTDKFGDPVDVIVHDLE